ncbi:FAD-binding monooxygenase [Amycolatopsis sp. NBRC 101858]|uniref:FAD-dependent monooxygenase n=1 Tax=Amycolatopsis sp. NBRC 101858 TaxID=3032200 RepID=UPI0024A535C4|nr:FAD-dependent monooxygenase [Amycolatopsis sp. NBRC 101858]GLY42728.1 FAD-binding monooxygenase [Amycolatopsis sp. NBRC 101858]
MHRRHGTSAVVIGAGMAGLMTARVLSDHVDRVLVLERDRLPRKPVARGGVPQGRHAHVLHATGRQLLDGWFPGLADDLVAGGAVPVDAGDLGWLRLPADPAFLALAASRPALEGAVRARLLRQRRTVSVVDETAVDGLVFEGGRVVGVRVAGTAHRADLVVACTGRHDRFLAQQAEQGFSVPGVSVVRNDSACWTRVVPRRPGDLDGAPAVVAAEQAPGHRTGTVVPAGPGEWIVTLCSWHDDVPAEPAAFEDFARSLPSPLIAAVLAKAEGRAPILTHRTPTSLRRHVERLKRPPAGFLVLGDAICSLNPRYRQGMTSAALQARELDRALVRHGPLAPDLARVFYRAAGQVVATPWKLAAWADFADPRISGTRPPGTDLVNRGLDRVSRAARASASVAHRAQRVQNLLARPETLLTPVMILRIASGQTPPG